MNISKDLGNINLEKDFFVVDREPVHLYKD